MSERVKTKITIIGLIGILITASHLPIDGLYELIMLIGYVASVILVFSVNPLEGE